MDKTKFHPFRSFNDLVVGCREDNIVQVSYVPLESFTWAWDKIENMLLNGNCVLKTLFLDPLR